MDLPFEYMFSIKHSRHPRDLFRDVDLCFTSSGSISPEQLASTVQYNSPAKGGNHDLELVVMANNEKMMSRVGDL
jgi:hypothetical protein